MCSSNKSVAVIMTVFNRKETTLRCLRELQKQVLPSDFNIDVYMTDDGSTDGTSDAVAKDFPYVHIINGNGTLYWNRGMIAAWEEATRTSSYDYYLWLNDDTFLYENAISNLLKWSTDKLDRSIIVGTTCDTHTHQITTYGGHTIKKGKLTPNGELQECDMFNGNIVLIPAYVFTKLGTNDRSYSHTLGDFDYGLRAKRLGLHSFISPVFVGDCDRHGKRPTWCDPNTPLKKRWKMYFHPLGAAQVENWHFDLKYRGLIVAIHGLCLNFTKMLFPKLYGDNSKYNRIYFNK